MLIIYCHVSAFLQNKLSLIITFNFKGEKFKICKTVSDNIFLHPNLYNLNYSKTYTIHLFENFIAFIICVRALSGFISARLKYFAI